MSRRDLSKVRSVSYSRRRMSQGRGRREGRKRGALARLARDQRGQGMTEYLIVFVSLLVPLFLMTEFMSRMVRLYLLGIYTYMSWPFP